MSRPRFFADHDFNENIIQGVLRREPTIEFIRAREVGLESNPDSDILAFATQQQLIVLSHDVNTMTAAAFARMAAGHSLSGVFMVEQLDSVAPIIESLVMIAVAREAEEWADQVNFLPL